MPVVKCTIGGKTTEKEFPYSMDGLVAAKQAAKKCRDDGGKPRVIHKRHGAHPVPSGSTSSRY